MAPRIGRDLGCNAKYSFICFDYGDLFAILLKS